MKCRSQRSLLQLSCTQNHTLMFSVAASHSLNGINESTLGKSSHSLTSYHSGEQSLMQEYYELEYELQADIKAALLKLKLDLPPNKADQMANSFHGIVTQGRDWAIPECISFLNESAFKAH